MYNRTQRKKIGVKIPLLKFALNYRIEISQLNCFGCITVMRIQCKNEPKINTLKRCVILVGYRQLKMFVLRHKRVK